MKSKTQPEPVVSPTDEPRMEDTEVQPATRTMRNKTVLTVVMIAVLSISVLWWSVQRTAGNPTDVAVATTEPEAQPHENTKAMSPHLARIDEAYASMDHRLVSLSGRLQREFKTQHADSAEVMQVLSGQTERLQVINAAIADLAKRNQALDGRIREATSRLESLTQAVAALKVVTHKSAPAHKPRPAKNPPFQIDAIDIWDDATYVAVSQAGRVAFLKTAEQQSGWTITRIDRLKGQVDVRGPDGQVHSISITR